MLTSITIATIFGPILVFVGIWVLLYPANMRKVVESFRKTPAVLFITGIINLILGLAFVTNCNTWTPSFELLVTLLGWLFLLRGLAIFFLPQRFLKIFTMHKSSYSVFALVSIIWGLALSYFAFMK